MTITDIAKLAGVSISTVSKVVNGKTAGIAEATREKVLRIVKEYNYTPYASVKTASNAKSLLLGALFRNDRIGRLCMEGVIDAAYQQGYAPIASFYDEEEEALKRLTLLLSHHVDGVIMEKHFQNMFGIEKVLDDMDVPYIQLDLRSGKRSDGLRMDYERFGYETTRRLVEKEHQRIACFTEDHGEAAEKFQQGYQRCLYAHDIRVDPQLSLCWGEGHPDIAMLSVTGIVCQSVRIGAEAVQQARRQNYDVPRDLSVVCLDMVDSAEDAAWLSRIPVSPADYGRCGCEKLVARLESREDTAQFAPTLRLSSRASIDLPATLRNGKIVVVGALNMDTMVSVNCLPRLGETTTAAGHAIIPGGKGVNQAIGCARLGAETYLIGRLGRDYEGNSLFAALTANHIDIRGVKTDTQLATGRAYVYVQDDGESSIVIYKGANANLTPGDIESERHVFASASYCLLQTEIHYETVETAARIARECGAKVLLKPAAISEISDALLRNVTIFMPNLNEINLLCPEDVPLEEKAQHFLDRGVKNVIVTLAQDGCYFRSRKHSQYFPAARFEPVDTTGAADAFAAALTVYLADGYVMASAIRYATCAAGFSITRQGVPPALIDRDQLELLVANE